MKPPILLKKITGIMFFLISVTGCATTEVEIRERADSGYYQNHVRSDLVRTQIDETFESVRRIQSTVTYRTYQFELGNLPRQSEVRGANLQQLAVETKVDNHSTAGSAMVLTAAQRGRVGLLTAAHVATFPDTIWHYSGVRVEGADNRVEAISLRENLNQFVFTDDGIELIELVVADDRRDLAMLRTKSPVRSASNLIPLRLPAGDVTQIRTADMIYAMGYPRGVQMVTQGVVNLTQHPIRTLILDISLNRGFSGGSAFAVRSDGSGLEWVGIITSTLGEREHYLAPEDVFDHEYTPDIEYTGRIFIRSTTRIYYGMTNAVDIDHIRTFLLENWNTLRDAGIMVPML
jgi:S1-C subfamily serine protease